MRCHFKPEKGGLVYQIKKMLHLQSPPFLCAASHVHFNNKPRALTESFNMGTYVSKFKTHEHAFM